MSAAVDFLDSNEVSVLVSDIMMPSGEAFPGIDSSETGFHFVSLVREEFPDVRVICLSVIGDQTKIEKLKRQGALYLRKGETPLETAAKLIETKATGVINF
jgi:DNA-binding NarL/FixJ family response regulator